MLIGFREKYNSLSKTSDYDDWITTEALFQKLNIIWGPFTIDRFADTKNIKTKRFNSKFYCPCSEGIDAFSYSWEGENNFIVPPVYLISKVLKHV